VPFNNEIREHPREEAWRANVHGDPDCEKAFDEVWRDNNVTKPQRRESDFAESPDVHDPRIAIETLQ